MNVCQTYFGHVQVLCNHTIGGYVTIWSTWRHVVDTQDPILAAIRTLRAELSANRPPHRREKAVGNRKILYFRSLVRYAIEEGQIPPQHIHKTGGFGPKTGGLEAVGAFSR